MILLAVLAATAMIVVMSASPAAAETMATGDSQSGGTSRTTMVPNPKRVALEEELKRAKEVLRVATRELDGMNAHSTFNELERRIAELEEQIANTPAYVMHTDADGMIVVRVPNPKRAQLQEDLQRAKETLDAYKLRHMTPAHPDYIHLERIIAEFEATIADTPEYIVGSTTHTDTAGTETVMVPNPKLAQLQEELGRAKEGLNVLKIKGMNPAHPDYKRLERIIAAFEEQIANAPAYVVSSVTYTDTPGTKAMVPNPVLLDLKEELRRAQDSLDMAWHAGLAADQPDVQRLEKWIAWLETYIAHTPIESGQRLFVQGGGNPRRAALIQKRQDILTEMGNRSESIDYPDIQPLVKRLVAIELELTDDAERLLALSQPRSDWWSGQTSAWIVGLLGAGFVLLTIVYIYLMRKRAPYRTILGVLAAELVLGVVCLVLGFVMLARSQPIYTYSPLFFIGTAAYAGALASGFKLRRYYREIELRKMRAMDAP